MKWKVFNNNGLPLRKSDPFDVLGTVIGGIMQSQDTEATNAKNAHIAWQNREWQSKENEIQRNWEEQQKQVERQYNTPAAQMQRYKEAGLNPFLMGQGGQVGSGQTQAPAAPAPQSAPGFIPMQKSNIGDYFARGLGGVMDYLLQKKGVDASAADNTAKAEEMVIKNAIEIRKFFGDDAAKKYYTTRMSELRGATIDHSVGWNNLLNEYKVQENKAELSSIEASIEREVGRERAVTVINDMKQRIHNSQAQESLWKTLENLNDENAKLAKAESARNYAQVREIRQHIEKMKAEIKELNTRAYMEFAYGCLADAKTLTEDSIRGFYVNQMQNKALEMGLNYQEHAAEFESMEGARDWMRSKEGKANMRSEFIFEHDPLTKRINQFTGFVGNLMNSMPQLKVPKGAKYTRYGHMPNGDKLVKSWIE